MWLGRPVFLLENLYAQAMVGVEQKDNHPALAPANHLPLEH